LGGANVVLALQAPANLPKATAPSAAVEQTSPVEQPKKLVTSGAMEVSPWGILVPTSSDNAIRSESIHGTAPSCDSCFANPEPPCGPPGRVWFDAEYLLWWTKNDHVPPLITTGPATFPVGFLGNPGTTVLFGGSLDRNPFSGAR